MLPSPPMGAFDREYFRGERQPERPRLPPVTKALLIANLVIYFVDMLFLKQAVAKWGCFTIHSAFQEKALWELLTFQFLHGSVGHVVFNSIGLYFFGPWMERWWGSVRFTVFYLLCGVAGALFYTLLTWLGILPERGFLAGEYVPLLGASAGLYGLIVGVAVIQPNTKVHLLFPPVSLTLRTAALGFIGLAVAVILGDILIGGVLFKNSGGEAGHLGGAILGFLLMKFPFLLRRGSRPRKIIRPPEFRRKSSPKLRPRSVVDVSAASEVDRVLDKIIREGVQSLTDEDRKTLDRVAKSHDEP